MSLLPIRLLKNHDRRLRAGHAWIYSNEIDTAATHLSLFEPGQLVEVQTHSGQFIGSGYINPHSLICVRLLSRDPQHPPSQALITHRINMALSLRQRLFPAPFYRLIYGESDGLPSLIVDRYGDVLVAQISTAGMEKLKAEVLAALEKVVKPRVIVLRNDSPAREIEGLPSYVETALGEAPEEVALEENQAKFRARPLRGQKTGWFYDHRMNRARMQAYAAGARVLDVFCYSGAWAVQAALGGAKEAWCVDSSADALQLAQANAGLNGVALQTLQADAFDALKQLRADQQRFDLVIVDPPAFIKRKKDQAAGSEISFHAV